jgi:palmitoyltransferase
VSEQTRYWTGLAVDLPSPKKTLLFPLIIPPASNGWSFPRRSLPVESHRQSGPSNLHEPELSAGLVSPDSARAENGHAGLGFGERSRYVMGDDGSLTDDEEGGGGFID